MSYLINNYSRQDIVFERGKGIYLYDVTGREYIDFGCGISVTNLGHVHPYITAKAKEQADRLWHTSNIFTNDLTERLAHRISAASFGGKLFLCNSGAEANEAAIKLARIYNNKVHGGRKPRIITMMGGFHGRTYATMSATAQEKIQRGFEPMAPFFTYVPYNDAEAVRSELERGDVCAVMLELYQGESGVIPAEEEYVRSLRSMASEHGALLIFDEVQTGYGRTGKLFAYEHIDVTPDIITMAKSMANGLPIGAVQASEQLAELFTPGTHGSTFGGNLIVCAAADAVLDIMLEDGFLQSVYDRGNLFRKALADAFGGYGAVVRGKGFLAGIELPGENGSFIKEALVQGLVVIPGGKTTVRFYPPLNASDSELDEGISRALKAMENIYGGR